MEGIDPDTLLEWLQTDAGEERELQLMALEQLCMLLLMSDNIDRCFENYPPRTFIPALCKIIVDESAPENVLEVTARAVTYYLDVSNECTRRITQVEGAVKAICTRLASAEMSNRTSRDLAEQCVKLLEHVCQRETAAVHDAGGLPSMLTFVNQNGSTVHKDTLYSAMAVVMRLCSRVEPRDPTLRQCSVDLGRLLAYEDCKVAESSLRCFAALIDRFVRRNMDPAEVAEPSDLVNHLLDSLLAGKERADAAAMSSSFISTVLSLLSNLCRGSHSVTTKVLSSPKLVPALKYVFSLKDERCVLDAVRVADLLMVLMCEGRASLPKASSFSVNDNQAASSASDRSHRFLIDAIRQRDTDALIDAFENGQVDPNFTDDAGQTLLNWCAAFGTLEMVQYLCDKGADVNKGQRSSSLHYAACFGRVEIVTALLHNGANPEMRDEEGRTALDKARERADDHHQQVIQILENPSSYMVPEKRSLAPSDQQEEPSVADQATIDPDVGRAVVQQLIPILCAVFSRSLVPAVRRASLTLLGRAIQYCSAASLAALIENDKLIEKGSTSDDDFFVDNLLKVIVSVLNEDDNTDGHEQIMKILISLLSKGPGDWVQELLRLGVVKKVEQMAATAHDQHEAPCTTAPDSEPRLSQPPPESAQLINVPVLTEAELAAELCAQAEKAEECDPDSAPLPSAAPSSTPDSWEIGPRTMYKWHDWRLTRSSDSMYIWCDAVALELNDGSNGWLRFFLDGKLSTMYSSGVPESGPDNTETRSEFIRKFQSVRNLTVNGTPARPVLSRPVPGKTIESGNWRLASTEPNTLVITNSEGTQQKIVIKEDMPGFQYEASKFTTKNFMAESTLGSIFMTEAQKQKVQELAKELYDVYLKETQNKPREVFVELQSAAVELLRRVRELARNQDNLAKGEKLSEVLCRIRDLMANERLLSTYELATSGVVPALLELAGGALAVSDGVIAQVFYKVFADQNVLGAVVGRLIQVFESVEKFDQSLYDAAGGSAFGFQLLTRRFRFTMEQIQPTLATQSDLLDRTGRVLKTEPLTTVFQVRTFLQRMVAKMWYDFPRASMEFVRTLSSNMRRDVHTQFVYESDFDTNGLIWYLGTNGLRQPEWVNPGAVGVVKVSCFDGAKLPYGCPEDVLSRDVNALNCHSSDNKSAYFAIDLGVFIKPSAYTLRHARGYGRSALRTWDLEGSVDNVKFFLLSRHEDDKSMNDAGSTCTFFIPWSDNFPHVRYIRIQQRGVNASGITHYLSLSGFEIYGDVLGVVTEPLSPEHAGKCSKKLRSPSHKAGHQYGGEAPTRAPVRCPKVGRKAAQGVNLGNFLKLFDGVQTAHAHEVAQSCTAKPRQGFGRGGAKAAETSVPEQGQSQAANPAAVASSRDSPQPIGNANIQQKSMSTTNLLDAHAAGTRNVFSVSATQQASSAESLQRQSPSLENLLCRARMFAAADRRIPEAVPENFALNDYSSAEANSTPSVAEDDDRSQDEKHLSASTPELVPLGAAREGAQQSNGDTRPPLECVDELHGSELYSGMVDLYQEMVRSGELGSIEDASELEQVVLSNCIPSAILDEMIETDRLEQLQLADDSGDQLAFIDGGEKQRGGTPRSDRAEELPGRHALANLGQGIRSKLENYAGALKNIVTQAVECKPEKQGDISGISHLEEFFDDLFAEEDDFEDDYGTSLPGAEGNSLSRLTSIGQMNCALAGEGQDAASENAGPSSSSDTPTVTAALRLNWRNILRGGAAQAEQSNSAASSAPIPLRAELLRMLAQSSQSGQLLDGAGFRGASSQHRANTGGRNSRKPTRNWDDEYVLRRQFHALIPAFDPRPGRNNVNQTTDLELPAKDVKAPSACPRRKRSVTSTTEGQKSPRLQLFLRGPNLNGHENAVVPLLNDQETIFSAVQRLLSCTTFVGKGDRARKIWEPSYTLLYKLADDSDGALSRSRTESSLSGGPVQECLDVLQKFYLLLEAKVSPCNFVSQKITQKLCQVLADPLLVCADALPSWCATLVYNYPCLFSLETRSMFLNATSFGTSRAIVWLQNRRDHMLEEARASAATTSTSNVASARRDDHYPEFRIGRIKHERIKVHRSDEQLFENAVRVMKFHAGRKAILEIEYVGEEGTGLGPTLEFYALVAAEFQRKQLAMWLCDDSDEQQQQLERTALDLGEGVKPPGYYVRRAGGLFPAPLSADPQEAERVTELFRVLGIFLAKVLQDGRLVDLPLALPFLRLLISDTVSGGADEGQPAVSLDGLLGLGDLELVHPHKARFLRAVQRLCAEKASIRSDSSLTAPRKAELIGDLRLRFNDDEEHEHECRVEDLGLTFVVNPSSEVFKFTEHELLPGGAHIDVSIDNVELYLGKCVDFYLNSGITRQVAAFRAGFDCVFPLRALKTFSAAEVRKLLSGEQCPEWSREELINFTEPKLGYTRDSPGFLRFVDVVTEMSAEERKAFLQFTTGCSSLPPGGLANLHPRLTVVRKVDGGGDGSYPSVNTCVHYLKLPEYSSAAVLRERLLAATSEKGFHLN